MGNIFSNKKVKFVNYNCPVCMESGLTPNIAGKFFIINDKECQCNGCKKIFNKSDFYKSKMSKLV
jgi:hypothetical protein